MHKHHFRGLKSISINPREKNLVFQAIDWVSKDEWFEIENDNSDDEYEYEHKKYKEKEKKFVIYCYGSTKEGNSIRLKINDFQPYFFVKLPDTFTETNLRDLKRYVKSKVEGYRPEDKPRLEESLISAKIIKRKDVYFFSNNKEFKFACFKFKSKEAFHSYSNVFKEPIKLRSFKNEYQFKLYESNIPPLLRFYHINGLKASGWIELEKSNYERTFGRNSTCQIEIEADYRNVKLYKSNDIAPIKVLSFDIECMSGDGESFPSFLKKEDKIIQIGSTVHYIGQDKQTVSYQNIITIGDKRGKCNSIEGVDLKAVRNEKDLLLQWTKLVQELDPDVLTGYNINGFDWEYMYKRAELLGIEKRFCMLGREKNKVEKYQEKNLSSAALGDNILKYIETTGRINIDVMKVVQKDYKLEMYKLDFVAETFLNMNKVDLPPNELFRKWKNNTAEDIKDIAEYCIQDCALCNKLIDKLQIVVSNLGMSNVCSVPFEWLFSRGQGIKIFSLFAQFCRQKKFLIKVNDKIPKTDYEGAVVLVATPGLYLDPIAVNDFASLYPSSMISHNISHDSIVWFKEYDNSGNLIREQGIKEKGKFIYDNLPEFNYHEIRYDNIKTDENNNKFKSGYTICRFAEHKSGKKGIVPEIEEELLWQRRVTRASAYYCNVFLKDGTKLIGTVKDKPELDYIEVAEYKQPATKVYKKDLVKYEEIYDNFRKSVLDGLQLAYKVVCNSVYGQIGSNVSSLCFMELAACTTCVGRELLSGARDFAEREYPGAECVYGDSVTGDTPLILKKDNNIIIKTIEELGDDWIPYEGFKINESNRKEKQQCSSNFEIWVKDHWSPIKRVIRHKTNKKIYRINTHKGLIDVTEDHSLLDEDGNKLKPEECILNKTKLMHGIPQVSFNSNFENVKIISNKVEAQKYYLSIINKFNVKIFNVNNHIYVEKTTENLDNSVISVVFLRNTEKNEFVYDIETETGNFNAGIGELCIKNTDSVFVSYRGYFEKELEKFQKLTTAKQTSHLKSLLSEAQQCKKNKDDTGESTAILWHKMFSNNEMLKDKDLLQQSINMGILMGIGYTKTIKKPHDLEYEKTFFPFIQIAKKRYVGNLYELEINKYKQKSMGIALKRRDNAHICKKVFGKVVETLLNERDVDKTITEFRKNVCDLLNGHCDIKDLILTKTLRGKYKGIHKKTGEQGEFKWDKVSCTQAHVSLSQKIGIRDPGNKPQSNDRIPFVYILTDEKKGKKTLQGDKVEHPDFIKENKDKIIPDYYYYLEHQVKKPCLQVFALVLEKLPGYHKSFQTVLNKKKNELIEKNKSDIEITKKLQELKEKEAERLLLSEITNKHVQNNLKKNTLITDFFNQGSNYNKEDEITEEPEDTKTINQAIKSTILDKRYNSPISTKSKEEAKKKLAKIKSKSKSKF